MPLFLWNKNCNEVYWRGLFSLVLWISNRRYFMISNKCEHFPRMGICCRAIFHKQICVITLSLIYNDDFFKRPIHVFINLMRLHRPRTKSEVDKLSSDLYNIDCPISKGSNIFMIMNQKLTISLQKITKTFVLFF